MVRWNMHKIDGVRNMDLYEFPSVKKAIEDFINDEDGNITRSQMVTLGTLVLVMSIMSAMDVYAKHGSHGSHVSHSSTSYIRSHSNHVSHSDHGSHESHSSHTSHSNTASHSNSIYSSEGDVNYGPDVSSIPRLSADVQSNSIIAPGEVANTNTTTASISNIELPEVPDAPTVPDTIAMGTIQSTATIAPLTVDPNHTMVDEIKENLITMDE